MYCHPSTTSLQLDAWLYTHFQQWGDLACFEQVWEWAHWWSEAFTGFLQNKKCEGEYSSIKESRGSPAGGERSLWWSWECVCSIYLQRSRWQHWQLWRVGAGVWTQTKDNAWGAASGSVLTPLLCPEYVFAPHWESWSPGI